MVAPPTLVFCFLEIGHAIGIASVPFAPVEVAVLVGLTCLLRLPMSVILKCLVALIYAPVMWYGMLMLTFYVACFRFGSCP